MDKSCGRLFLQLVTEPLGFLLEINHEEKSARQFFLPVSVATAQSLALALLSQPGVSGELDPGLRKDIQEAVAAAKEADSQFLRDVGVSA